MEQRYLEVQRESQHLVLCTSLVQCFQRRRKLFVQLHRRELTPQPTTTTNDRTGSRTSSPPDSSDSDPIHTATVRRETREERRHQINILQQRTARAEEVAERLRLRDIERPPSTPQDRLDRLGAIIELRRQAAYPKAQSQPHDAFWCQQG